MKTLIALTLAGAMAGMSMTASASPQWRHHDEYRETQRARVVEVVPVTRLVRVAVERAPEVVHTRVVRRGNDGAALVGGVIGGIIGHNIGDGRGGATVAGAIIGAAVGQSLAPDRRAYRETVAYTPHQRTRYETRRVLVGYDVTYRFHGRLYTTRTQDRPHRFIRVDHRVAYR